MLAIIGCGNANRSDDGAGLVVARKLRERLQGTNPDAVRIFDAGTDGMGVMFLARGASSLVIVDASNSGAEAGAVFEVPGQELEGKPPDSFNLHDFRWDHALYAGRKIFKDDFPKDVSVFLIEAANLEFGLELSGPVARACETVTQKLAARIAERCEAGGQHLQGASIRLSRGSLHFDAAIYERYFSGLESVILLRRENRLVIMPVRHAMAGGYLLKLKNSAGDRVVHASDFFQSNGIGPEVERAFEAFWSADLAGLVASHVF